MKYIGILDSKAEWPTNKYHVPVSLQFLKIRIKNKLIKNRLFTHFRFIHRHLHPHHHQ